MIFDCEKLAHTCQLWDDQFSSPVQLDGDGLWVGVLSSGRCSLEQASAGAVMAGSLLIGPSPLDLAPLSPCHLMAVRIEGRAADLFLEQLPSPMFADGSSCPEAAQLLAMLACAPASSRSCGLCCQLLCEISNADSALPVYSPLVEEAVASIRENYAGLYGVEELSSSLGVSKSHLVRTFKEQVGITPGQYLTQVRIETAKQLLCRPEYSLEVVASLCGFSGANYLCRVFRQHTGMTPATYRSNLGTASRSAPETLLPQEKALYV